MSDDRSKAGLKKKEIMAKRLQTQSKSQEHMLGVMARMIRARGRLPESLIERLAMVRDESLHERLSKANDRGQVAEAIKAEPRLKFLADKLDR